MPNRLIQPLFDDPLDIVGDVHGEIVPLRSLMGHLGYDEHGEHPDGRRLVFVGDLTDRGPDSPAVVHLVQRLIESGRAQCVLGNHDLNILLDHRKHDNGWFFGEEFLADGKVVPQELADKSIRKQVLDFFRTLPIALERDDLRVVHACWNDEMIDIARESGDVVALYHEHHEQIEQSFPDLDLDEIDQRLTHQNNNPVKKLTSGPEERTAKPVNAGGKIRNEQRVTWWPNYHDTFCVFGHYSIPNGEPRSGESAFCVDYGVGKRWRERREAKNSGFRLKLAALRWPERVIVFDEGESKHARLPSWEPDGGIVVEIHLPKHHWNLPTEATPIEQCHVTLIGRKVFQEQDEMKRAWEMVRHTLPMPPQPKLDEDVHEAVDGDRRTWFLHVRNQDVFRCYVERLTDMLDDAVRQISGSGFSNLETDRYFHISIANNRGGDPMKSIGSIKPPQE